ALDGVLLARRAERGEAVVVLPLEAFGEPPGTYGARVVPPERGDLRESPGERVGSIENKSYQDRGDTGPDFRALAPAGSCGLADPGNQQRKKYGDARVSVKDVRVETAPRHHAQQY